MDQDLQPGGPYCLRACAPVGAFGLGRVFIGSTTGELFALDSCGKPAFKHTAKAAIEAPVTLDATRGELYAASVDGNVALLDATSGTQRWEVSVEEAVSQRGLLSADALYLVTDLDTVVALNRADGALLWRYRRTERPSFSRRRPLGLRSPRPGTSPRSVTAWWPRSIPATYSSSGIDTSLDCGDGRTQRYLRSTRPAASMRRLVRLSPRTLRPRLHTALPQPKPSQKLRPRD